MKQIQIVVGANYGDEGKGSVVNQLCSPTTLVVRYSGGAQAGHTVNHDGVRHVFHHFGSGTCKGAATYLTQDFVVNPWSFHQEREELVAHGLQPVIFINQGAQITTVYDMLLNQIREAARGESRHGSCGLGIFETKARSRHLDFVVSDVVGWHGTSDFTTQVKNKLKEIRDYCVSVATPWCVSTELQELLADLASDASDNSFIADLEYLVRRATVCGSSVYSFADHIVFESSQGLMLDQRYGVYPYLTPSDVGAYGAAQEIMKSGCDSLEIIYVTRPYLTRHGAGPLPNESSAHDLGLVVEDHTNVWNQHQGHIRYAPLDAQQMIQRIELDCFSCVNQLVDVLNTGAELNIAVSCLDQVKSMVHLVGRQVFKTNFINYLLTRSAANAVFETDECKTKSTKIKFDELM